MSAIRNGQTRGVGTEEDRTDPAGDSPPACSVKMVRHDPSSRLEKREENQAIRGTASQSVYRQYRHDLSTNEDRRSTGTVWILLAYRVTVRCSHRGRFDRRNAGGDICITVPDMWDEDSPLHSSCTDPERLLRRTSGIYPYDTRCGIGGGSQGRPHQR